MLVNRTYDRILPKRADSRDFGTFQSVSLFLQCTCTAGRHPFHVCAQGHVCIG